MPAKKIDLSSYVDETGQALPFAAGSGSGGPSRLEKQYATTFNAWKTQPTPENASAMLTQLKPVIDRGVQTYAGGSASSNVHSQARQMTLQALQTYDPAQSRLGTHVTNHLQGLRRVARQSQQIIKMPERVVLDRAHVNEAKAQLSDTLGRDPSLQELADHTGLSVRRLQYLEQFRPPVAEGTLSSINTGEDSRGFMPAVEQNSRQHLWLDAIYHDLDGRNQRIMEWTLGLHGQPKLTNQQIASKLKISPGAVSQRKAQIQAQLDAVHDMGYI